MHQKLKWQKKIFSNLYRIYCNGQQIGSLKEKSFSNDASAKLNNNRYSFTTTGFFEQTTKIFDLKENKIVGKITYSSWRTKATITLDKKVAYWKYENFWNTKWSINNDEGTQINYKGSYSNGNIDSNTDDSLLLLSGLYITNYYWQTSIVILMVILIPIFLNN